MDTLDRLLARLDTHVATAQDALAALERARTPEQDSPGAAVVSVWRPGRRAQPVVHAGFEVSFDGLSAHQRLAQEGLAVRVHTALAHVQDTLRALSSTLSAGPVWRTLQAWPRLFVSLESTRVQSLVTLLPTAPTSGVVMGETWTWGTRAFHTACRLALDIQPKVGHGPAWTVRHAHGTKPSQERRAEDAATALALHALWGYPEILGSANRAHDLVLSRVEENLPQTIALLRAPLRAVPTHHSALASF